MIEIGRYIRKSDKRSVWVIEVNPVEGDYPQLKIRRPKGAFHAVCVISARGFLARHQKVAD